MSPLFLFSMHNSTCNPGKVNFILYILHGARLKKIRPGFLLTIKNIKSIKTYSFFT